MLMMNFIVSSDEDGFPDLLTLQPLWEPTPIFTNGPGEITKEEYDIAMKEATEGAHQARLNFGLLPGSTEVWGRDLLDVVDQSAALSFVHEDGKWMDGMCDPTNDAFKTAWVKYADTVDIAVCGWAAEHPTVQLPPRFTSRLNYYLRLRPDLHQWTPLPTSWFLIYVNDRWKRCRPVFAEVSFFAQKMEWPRRFDV
jgi:hypothetical protein